MNILFYLVPKNKVVYIYDDYTVGETMETMETCGYAAVPIINRKGGYVGSLTEGDILWGLKKQTVKDLEETKKIPVRQLKRCRDNQPVNINCNMEDLIMTAMHQNYIPVVDDEGVFIGIITRKSIISYCFEQYKKVNAQKEKEEQ